MQDPDLANFVHPTPMPRATNIGARRGRRKTSILCTTGSIRRANTIESNYFDKRIIRLPNPV